MEEIIKDSARLGSKALRTKYRFSEATIKNVRQAYASAVNGDLEQLAKVYSRSAPIARWACKFLTDDQRELFDRGFYGPDVKEIKDPEEDFTPTKEYDSSVPENNSEPDKYEIYEKIIEDLELAKTFLRDVRSISACLSALGVADQDGTLRPAAFLGEQLALRSEQVNFAIYSLDEHLKHFIRLVFKQERVEG